MTPRDVAAMALRLDVLERDLRDLRADLRRTRRDLDPVTDPAEIAALVAELGLDLGPSPYG